MFLTGAGASFGCGNTFPKNPPLGKNLYKALEEYFPIEMKKLTDIIGSKNTENFEEKMYQAVYNNKVNNTEINALIAMYFSQFKPMNGNSFMNLFFKLSDEDIEYVYSTLNYDCIGELAALKIGLNCNYSIENMPSNHFDILKLHGSCNFLVGGVLGPVGSISVELGGQFEGMIEPVDPRIAHDLILEQAGLVCMAYYMNGKPTSVGSSVIEKIQNKWKECIATSDYLILIGINVNPNDSHIWDSIKSSNVKIGFVGSNDAYSTLCSMNASLDSTYIAPYFSSSVSEIINFVS